VSRSESLSHREAEKETLEVDQSERRSRVESQAAIEEGKEVSDEELHIGDLKPDPNNARKHNPRNVGMIEDSLHDVGAARSIVIDEDNVVLAGNATTEAAASAGIEKVRVVEADGNEIIAVRRRNLSPEQKLRLALADNRAAELAEWDIPVLSAIRDEFPRAIEAAFRDTEFDALLAKGGEEKPLEDDDKPKGEKRFVIQYNVIFDSEEQQAIFHRYLGWLKQRYPDMETLGERIALDLRYRMGEIEE